jgi:hypothetical protein
VLSQATRLVQNTITFSYFFNLSKLFQSQIIYHWLTTYRF